MQLLGWLLIDAVVGWVASRVMQTDEHRSSIANFVVGFAGASLSGWLLARITYNQSELTLAGIFVSFLGAIALLGLANLIRSRIRAR